jgi:endonuclease III
MKARISRGNTRASMSRTPAQSKSQTAPAKKSSTKPKTKSKSGPVLAVKESSAANKPKAPTQRVGETKSKGSTAFKQTSAPATKLPIAKIFERFREKTPEPKGELEHVNAYTLLVAVVLSAQATDAGVNKATRALFKAADTPEKMVALGEDTVRDYVKTIGLYRNKAKNVILLSQKLIAEHASKVPADRDALTALPGVGRKTANVVLNMAFGQKTMAVDTHVFRVAHRIGLSAGKNPEAVEGDLMRSIPDDYLFHAHHWLILHGRYTCLARKPRCGLCPIADLCTSEEKVADA